ncbi:PA14 domain-containing protein [Larkinella sp. VNQ87]|uniref:PA14 domain-containing protein n=1 Tax=Larkinella sp. VNQ87 TaxID=3400921 RepID=UPI003C009085
MNFLRFTTTILSLCLLTTLQLFGQTKYGTSFTFSLSQSARTSAGVYSKDGTLIRTLWSGVTYGAGSHNQTWDGADDQGRLVPEGNYDIKILSNNVTYTWEGVIGNSSQSFTGETVHRGLDPINSLLIVGSKAYYATNYSEGGQPIHAFNLGTPQVHQPVNLLGGNSSITAAATDGTTLFWAQSDPFATKNLIFAITETNSQQKTFSAGQTTTNKYNPTFSSALEVNTDSKGKITGLAVQITGKYLFVAYPQLNQIQVLDKTTGSRLRTITNISNPRALAMSGNFLWVLSATNTLQKFTIMPDGTLSLVTAFKPTNLEAPLALAISPSGQTLVVCDGGNSQQVKGFNTTSGALAWTLGKPGGYRTEPSVENDKFYFTDAVSPYQYTVVSFAPDGSFWVGDTGNRRLLHFSSARQYLEQIMYLPRTYACAVDVNKPTRVFHGYLEFAVDYSKPLAPNNGSWKLVRNWGQAVTTNYSDGYIRVFSPVTLANGRTYALTRSNKPDGRELIELPPSGPLRYTGIYCDHSTQLAPDGSLRRLQKTQGIQSWLQKPLQGFDARHNPVYGRETTVGSTNQTDGSNPAYGGAHHSPNAVTSSGILVSFDGSASTDKYHLGGLKSGQTGWVWKTAYATHTNYTGPFPADGRFDVGNGMGNGKNYAGNIAMTVDRHIIWGYNGEFWRNSQTNKWNHVYDNGLFVGQFGTTGPEVQNENAPAAGMAGNSFQGQLVKLADGRVYLYHGDESYHSGLHRWLISGLNTVREQVVSVRRQVTKGGLTGYYFASGDLNNLLHRSTRLDAGVNFASSNALMAGTSLSEREPCSVRWQGYVQASYTEAYTFWVKASKGVRLWVDGQVCLDRWSNNSDGEWNSQKIALQAGVRYALRLEVKGGGPVILGWSSNRQSKAVIGAEWLSPSTTPDSLLKMDLLYGVSGQSQVLADQLYGWQRNPVQEDYTDRHRDYWQVVTGKKTYQDQSPDICVTFRQDQGTYTVSRSLGASGPTDRWWLSGLINFEGNEGNVKSGGSFLEVLDEQDKVIARVYVDIDYSGERPRTVMGNGVTIISLSQKTMAGMLCQFKKLMVMGGSEGITFQYENFAPVTAQVVDKSSDWRRPRKLQLRFFCSDKNSNYNRAISLQSLYFASNPSKSGGRLGIEETAPRLLISPNPVESVLNVEHPSTGPDGVFTIFREDGRKYKRQPVKDGSTRTEIDTRSLPSGLYILQFEGNSFKTTTKFIKQ